jgi:hypothetical protein
MPETLSKNTCFVIMPFSETTKDHTEDYWTKHFSDFLKPEIESSGSFIAIRSSPLKGDILKQIITNLVISSVVIADLTDLNPNVLWELGVRQSFKNCTITIADYKTKLPFDLGGKGTLFYYPNNYIKMQGFLTNFHAALKECLEHPESTDSQVLETIGGRGSLFQVLRKQEILGRLNAIEKEISNNESILESICRMCELNSQRRVARQRDITKIAAVRFTEIAVEALIVNRYLDSGDTFYNSAYRYLETCSVCNQVIAAAISQENRERTDNWFLKNKLTKMQIFVSFHQQIIEQYNKLKTGN